MSRFFRKVLKKHPGHFFVSSLVLFASGLGLANPRAVELVDVRALGSACQPDRTATTFSPDGEALTLVFDELLSEAVYQQRSAYDRVFCRVNLRVRVPRGWQFGVFSWDTRGYVDIVGDAAATYNVGYSFGRSRYEFSEITYRGDSFDDVFVRDEIFAEDLAYSPCGQSRDVMMRVHAVVSTRAYRPGSAAFLVLDSIDGASFEQNFGIVWRQCSPGRF